MAARSQPRKGKTRAGLAALAAASFLLFAGKARAADETASIKSLEFAAGYLSPLLEASPARQAQLQGVTGEFGVDCAELLQTLAEGFTLANILNQGPGRIPTEPVLTAVNRVRASGRTGDAHVEALRAVAQEAARVRGKFDALSRKAAAGQARSARAVNGFHAQRILLDPARREALEVYVRRIRKLEKANRMLTQIIQMAQDQEAADAGWDAAAKQPARLRVEEADENFVSGARSAGARSGEFWRLPPEDPLPVNAGFRNATRELARLMAVQGFSRGQWEAAVAFLAFAAKFNLLRPNARPNDSFQLKIRGTVEGDELRVALWRDETSPVSRRSAFRPAQIVEFQTAINGNPRLLELLTAAEARVFAGFDGMSMGERGASLGLSMKSREGAGVSWAVLDEAGKIHGPVLVLDGKESMHVISRNDVERQLPHEARLRALGLRPARGGAISNAYRHRQWTADDPQKLAAGAKVAAQEDDVLHVEVPVTALALLPQR